MKCEDLPKQSTDVTSSKKDLHSTPAISIPPEDLHSTPAIRVPPEEVHSTPATLGFLQKLLGVP